jgi:hypothetical protein
VTIALGILATDGVVLASDTQVGITDYLKTGQGKIACCITRTLPGSASQTNTLAVTGAGNTTYLLASHRAMMDCLSTPEASINPNTLQVELQAALGQFYEGHILPFSGYPPNERPELQLVIGAQQGDEYTIWATEKNLLVREYQFAAVGVGAMYARILLGNLYAELDLRTAAALAAFVVFQVKQCIDGCGHDTDILVLRNGLPGATDRELTRKLEEQFREYSTIEASALHYALGASTEHAPSLNSLSDSFKSARKRLLEVIRSAELVPLESTICDPKDQPPSPE